MKKRTQAEHASDQEALTEQAVFKYLSNHPDFWAKYPKVVIQQNLSYKQFENVSSFYQYKLEKIEESYDTLVNEFQSAVEFAHHNQQLFLEFQKIIFDLLSKPQHLWTQILGEALAERDYADYIYELEVTPEGFQALSPHLRWHETYCGPFTPALSRILGMVDPTVKSCAILPFKRNRLFILGHCDPEHFSQEMETFFLNQLKGFLDAARHR